MIGSSPHVYHCTWVSVFFIHSHLSFRYEGHKRRRNFYRRQEGRGGWVHKCSFYIHLFPLIIFTSLFFSLQVMNSRKTTSLSLRRIHRHRPARDRVQFITLINITEQQFNLLMTHWCFRKDVSLMVGSCPAAPPTTLDLSESQPRKKKLVAPALSLSLGDKITKRFIVVTFTLQYFKLTSWSFGFGIPASCFVFRSFRVDGFRRLPLVVPLSIPWRRRRPGVGLWPGRHRNSLGQRVAALSHLRPGSGRWEVKSL